MQIELEESVNKLIQSVQVVKARDATAQEGLFLKLQSAMHCLTSATHAGDGIVNSGNLGDYLNMVNQARGLITDPRFNEHATSQIRRFLRSCFEREPELYSAIPAPLKREYVYFL